MKYKIELFVSKRAKQPFYFRLKKGGKIIAQSEGYDKRGPRDRTANALADEIICNVTDLNPPEIKAGKEPKPPRSEALSDGY